MNDTWITDWTPSERFPVYTRANAGEVMAEPCSPLGWTLLWEAAMVPGWRDAFIRYGLLLERELPEHDAGVCGSFGGYLYNNLSLIRTYASRIPGSSVEAVDKAFIGDHPDKPAYVAHPDDADPEAMAKVAQSMGWVLSTEEFTELLEHRDLADASRRDRPDLAALSPEQLVARARALVPLLRTTFDGNVAAGMWSVVGPGMLDAMAPMLGDVTPLRLIAGLGDVDSAAPSMAIWELSRVVAGSDELSVAFDEGVDGLLDRLRPSGSDDADRFLERFDDFLLQYGSRGPNEWDIRADVWETKPELVLSQLERIRFVGDDESPVQRSAALRAKREALIETVSQRLVSDAEAAAMFATAVRVARVFLVGRERAKTNAIKVTNEIRVAMKELGRQMVAAGHLDHPDLVMMLVADELDDYVADPASRRSTLLARSYEYAELAELEPPYFVDRVVPSLTAWPKRVETTAVVSSSGDVLAGVAGSPGRATGRARVITDALQATTFEPGDILVAPSTDPSWTPLFTAASAVVVDTGALNSHAVIVSRELGIPCVPSVVAATLRIADGAAVTVDGDAGTVTIL